MQEIVPLELAEHRGGKRNLAMLVTSAHIPVPLAFSQGLPFVRASKRFRDEIKNCAPGDWCLGMRPATKHKLCRSDESTDSCVKGTDSQESAVHVPKRSNLKRDSRSAGSIAMTSNGVSITMPVTSDQVLSFNLPARVGILL